ncbi:YD repeat-containing protein [Diaminobutyricimonas aerilata]|uniref:YD repeat-containing protein n=1 Tax=Diaminobutyricimonas aerilata TaxID=1162967 RepID=A0A2M9CL56_9MICO|nr:hypothetical protein [Diaminobutyricimonas aerilata]PJJ72628.1 YD repeat-containing protein [Diaminobutyricimonas aerilata]
MINGFDCFGPGVEPLQLRFVDDDREWVAEVGFVTGPLGDGDVHAIVQFRATDGRVLPSYYCSTLLERPARARRSLRSADGSTAIGAETMRAVEDWMRGAPRSVGTATDGELLVDGRPAASLREVELALGTPDGTSRVAWDSNGRRTGITVRSKRIQRAS